MRLVKFTAEKVYGYLDFDIDFNDKMTFLTGANGSGKSTALKIVESLITPSLKDLAFTRFMKATLVFEHAGKTNVLSAVKDANGLVIATSWLDEVLRLDDVSEDQLDLLSEDNGMLDDYFKRLSVRLSTNEVFRAISTIPAPVFLGIERRHSQRALDGESTPFSRDGIRQGLRQGMRARRVLRGDLAAGLAETQALVQEAYRASRRQVDATQESLRNDVLLSAFHYVDPAKDEDGTPRFDLSFGSVDFESTRLDIEQALRGIGIPERKIEHNIRPFFEKISGLRPEAWEKSSDKFLELLMNKGQIDRLLHLISLVQDHKKRADASLKKISAFVGTINWFFRDCGKTVKVDAVGQIEISRGGVDRIPLDALSSGERQLLILISHLYFNAYGLRSKVFVIDEPELSLHMRWQENIVDKMLESNPGIQLIVATHSPDIVGEYRDMCVGVG
ncbi:AAA family ATPase [Stenotrophomonas maltophilia]